MKSKSVANIVLLLDTGTLPWNLVSQSTPPPLGGFAPTGSMVTARNSHTATLLGDGTC
jgi:hypothetical protein